MKRAIITFFSLLLFFAVCSFGAHLYVNGHRLFFATKTADSIEKRIEDHFLSYRIYEPREQFPDIGLYSLQDKKTGLFSTGEKYRLVNFWATWCGPCVVEIPSLLKLNKNLPQTSFEVVFISMDFPKNPDLLRKKMERVGLEGLDTLFIKSPDIWKKLPVQGLPVSFMLDPQGRIMYAFFGDRDWSDPAIESLIRSIISA